MATTYVDKSAAVDGDGTTESTPRNVVPTLTTGNTYLFKVGVNVGQQLTIPADSITLGAYGSGGGKAKIDGASTLNYGIYGIAVSGVTVSDFEIYGTRKGGVHIENDTASTTKTDIVIKRCLVYNVDPGGLLNNTEANIRIGTGILVGSGPTTGLAAINRVRIEDCVVHHCGRFGIDIRWRTLNVTRKRCRVYTCGYQAPGHGISSHPIGSTLTSGWTSSAGGDGNIFKRARASTNDVEQLLTDGTDALMLTKVGGTTPAYGEWSVDATQIYVNIGVNPNGKSLLLKRHLHGPFLDMDHVVYDIRDFTGVEGHGIDGDDSSGPMTILRCISYGNQGAGFNHNYGESITHRACLAYNNTKQGFKWLNIATPKAYGCTAGNNATRGFQWDGGANGEAKNCVATLNASSGEATTGTGFNVASTHTGFASATNAVWQNRGSTQVAGTGITASITTDPKFLSDYSFIAVSSLKDAGTHLGYVRDVQGKQRPNPPAVGAHDVATLRS